MADVNSIPQDFNEMITLFKSASEKNASFPDELGEYIVKQFGLQGVVIFTVEANGELAVLGKSSAVKQSYLPGAKFGCGTCSLLKGSDYGLHSDAKCELQISEFLVYECCYKFKLSAAKDGFLKFANKTPFTPQFAKTGEQISVFISGLYKIWSGESSGTTAHASSSGDNDFAGIVTSTGNELRGPINTIVGFTSILAEDNLTSSQSENVATIKQNAHDLLLSINDLIDLAKLNSGKITFNKRSVDIKTQVTEIVDIFKSKKENSGTEFVLNISNDVPVNVEADDQKLRYILNNILTFSTKTTTAGKITISVDKSADDSIQFEIADTGIGVAPDVKADAFAPFKLSGIDRLRHTTLSALGFTLVHEFIDLFGGSIKLDSEAGKGTKISFSLFSSEIKQTESPIEDQISQIPKPKPDGENLILVIEDDYSTQKLLEGYLTKWGYKPEVVNTEEETLGRIDSKQYLAIILDIEIPTINGLELLQKIRKHPKCKGTPIIVFSVDPEEQKAFMMGPVEYFVKPINYNYLVETLTSFKLRQNSNVLCVDDDVPTLNLIKQAIETAGFKAVAESVSANVMELIADKDIDLAIIDLDMPHPNGFELIKLIKSNTKFSNLPIIIYTGKENYQEDLQKIDGLFEELLDKRSTYIDDLADTINAMINRYETPPPVQEVIEKKEGVKILLAEDYRHSQIIVTRLLKKNNFQDIVIVENGEQALQMAKKEQFDLVLMDMQMPIMNGFEATEKLRQISNYKDTPIIALTAFAMKGDREKCLQAGATDYIPKPIDSKEFIEKVKYYTSVNN